MGTVRHFENAGASAESNNVAALFTERLHDPSAGQFAPLELGRIERQNILLLTCQQLLHVMGPGLRRQIYSNTTSEAHRKRHVKNFEVCGKCCIDKRRAFSDLTDR